MIAVVRPAGATVANRALQLVVQSTNGVLADVHAASYQVFSTLTPGQEMTPTQVFPTSGRQTLNLVTSRLGTGRYAATWDSSAAGPGRYLIRWFFQRTALTAEETFDQEFEVVTMPYVGPAYCAIYDLAWAGWTGSTTDGTAQRLIVQASRYIEHYTGRTFYPLYKTMILNGRRNRALLLREPIIALENVAADYGGLFPTDSRFEASSFRVYNRHLTQNLFAPDDRENPKLEFLNGWSEYGYYDGRGSQLGVPMGSQNVQVAGIFGYTEPDGSMVGQTPNLIRLACQLMCFKLQYPLGSQARQDAVNQSRLKSEYTRDQGYIMESPDKTAGAIPPITHFNDPEVDAILFGFKRQPGMGAV